MKTNSKTIVLIHGRENWVKFYEARGYTVHVPAYPGFEVEVEALRENTNPIAELTVTKVVDHLAAFLDTLNEKPILIGHSFGGTLVQMLLDRGYGEVGVVIDSAPVKGVLTLPFSQVKSLFPILKNPANRNRAAGFSAEEFHYAFTNALSREESDEAYAKYAIAAPGRIVFDAAILNFDPKAAAKVNFKNEHRAPLLFIAGQLDHIMPSSVNRANAKKYRAGIVAFHEFEGRDHFIAGERGWEDVATYALDWAKQPAAFGVN